MISPVGDVYLIAGMRAIMAYVHAEGGGPVELHAHMFEMSSGEFASALYRLKSNGRLTNVGRCRWMEVRNGRSLRAQRPRLRKDRGRPQHMPEMRQMVRRFLPESRGGAHKHDQMVRGPPVLLRGLGQEHRAARRIWQEGRASRPPFELPPFELPPSLLPEGAPLGLQKEEEAPGQKGEAQVNGFRTSRAPLFSSRGPRSSSGTAGP